MNMNLQGPIVQVSDVTKAFGDNQVLRGVSMTVNKGEAVALIGPSGSGKSTLLRCINGLVAADGGKIEAAGHAVHALRTNEDRIALRKDVCMVFQQYNLFPHMTVLENIMLAPTQVLKQDAEEVRERANKLLEKVRLTGKEKAYPGHLSGGQQQRVAIARALAMRPSVMLFDEVTAALDPETVKEVLATIRELVEEGMTCILVTHEMRFAREVAHQVYFTDKGLIVEHGAPAEFFDSPKDARTREFLGHVL
ncbi:amino acid ABC transporter ATP-binding protein [Herbaspirillum chlorophenolicum]|uniref:Amino acid ABC transporter ATP-binding protein n=1 Tax=Herbaspirillum chlorophenolicum TaxID=211589 RepID=A0ABW8F230_9BURK|nr:amino acid ABC transporter ATP-binding protein [Herbaspirillum chlorophenolicum]